GSRRENSGEHSWDLALFALVLSEHATAELDAMHAVKLLLIHDIAEIGGGDGPIYTAPGPKPALQSAAQKAADRMVAHLQQTQAEQFRAMWLEFEAGQTPEAQFAKALDRLLPLLLNVAVGGGT